MREELAVEEGRADLVGDGLDTVLAALDPRSVRALRPGTARAVEAAALVHPGQRRKHLGEARPRSVSQTGPDRTQPSRRFAGQMGPPGPSLADDSFLQGLAHGAT